MGIATKAHLRAPSYSLTYEDAIKIHGMIMQGMKQHDIAAKFGVNQGRISEINTGKRFPGSKEDALKRFGGK